MKSAARRSPTHDRGREATVLVLLAWALSCESLVGAEFEGLPKSNETPTGSGGTADLEDSSALGPDSASAAAAGTASGSDGAGGGGDGTSKGGGGTASGSAGAGGGSSGDTGTGGETIDGTDASSDGADSSGETGAAPEAGGATGASARQRLVPEPSDNPRSFGQSVALEGDWALVGSQESSGYPFAWVVHRKPSGEWGLEQKLPQPNGSAAIQFGQAVAITDRWALVGAPGHFQGLGLSGQAFFYKRETNDDWTPADRVQADPPTPAVTPLDAFGASLAIQGSTAVIGAHRENELRGAVYVYRQRSSWELWQKLVPPSIQPYDNLGWSVALDGNTLAACAVGDSARAGASGAVYIYELSGDTWSVRDKLFPTETGVSSFCNNMALEKDTLVLGAWTSGAGRAYIYTREPGGSFASRLPQLMTAPSGFGDTTAFAATVGLCEDTVLIGNWGGLDRVMNVFVYRPSAGIWSQTLELNSDSITSGTFGRVVACAGKTVLASDSSANGGQGAVYFFNLTP